MVLEGKVSRIGFNSGTLGKVYVTFDQLDALNTLPEVKHIAFEPKLKKHLDLAAPAMTGVVALWLEADPTLTADKARTIAMETAVVDDNVRNATYRAQYGAGKVDALAGLKRVLAEAPTT